VKVEIGNIDGNIHEYQWKSMDINGHPWIYIGSVSLDIHGYQWESISTAFHECGFPRTPNVRKP